MQAHQTSLLGFRALQALMDLRAAAGRQPQAAIRGIAERIPPTDRDRGADAQTLVKVILHQGARLETDADRPLLDALLTAASQPEANPAAFTCATAILLADRLQNGMGQDDLGAYWDAFNTTYLRLEPHDRAAIVQGFLAGKALDRVSMPAPPPTTATVTQSKDSLCADLLALAQRDTGAILTAVQSELDPATYSLSVQHLQALLDGKAAEQLTGDSPLFPPLLLLASQPDHPAYSATTALLLSQALRSQDAEGWFAVSLWSEQSRNWLAMDPAEGRAILAGLRHLYEADPTWTPLPAIAADPRRATRLPLLPVLDAAYSPQHPGTRAG